MKVGMAPEGGLSVAARRLAFAAIALSLTMAVLGQAIVNVALPVMGRDLGVDAASSVWAVNAYQLTMTVALLPFSQLGELIGYSRVYCLGLAVFIAGSLGCALAEGFPMLVAARVLQGLGGAGIISVNLATVRFIYPPHLFARAVGYVSIIGAASWTAGPTVAAAILSVASWPWLFLINVPLGLLALAIALKTLPQTPLRPGRFDWTSAVLNVLTFGLLIVGLDRISVGGSMLEPAALIAASAVVGTIFVKHQLRRPAPLLPLDLLRKPAFALATTSSVLAYSAQAIGLVSLPFFIHDELGYSVTQTAVLVTPWPLGVIAAAFVAGRLVGRFSAALLASVGLAIFGLGFALTATLPAGSAPVDILWRLTICGIGFGLFQTPNHQSIMSSAPRERSAGAGGVLTTARLLGQSCGAAMVAIAFGLFVEDRGIVVLWVAATLVLLGCLTSASRLFGRWAE
jgi:DHA2 family multidrug resistance protein-like MFS transporter